MRARDIIKFMFIHVGYFTLCFLVSFFIFCILVCFFILTYLPAFLGVDGYDDAKNAENWIKAEEKYDSSEKKFECLEMALHLYSTTSPKDFNWRYLLTKLDNLHKECGLKIKEDRLVNYCYQKDTDALDLLDQCISLNLISYNKYNDRYDSSLLKHLLQAILKEQQNNDKSAYVDKALKLMIKAIKNGADFRPFYSINDPLSVSKLIDDILIMNDFEVFKAIVDYKAVPHFILTEETTKQKILKCSNEQIVQYYFSHAFDKINP